MATPETTRAPRILLVEDEEKTRASIREGMVLEGWIVTEAADGGEASRLLKAGGFDLCVLDRMLPGRDGIELLGQLRGGGDATPVLMLTARGTLNDRLQGLDGGADDYLTKPFAFAELIARCRALLRRSDRNPPRILRCGDLQLDTRARVAVRAGREIALTPREVDVLEYFMLNQGHTVSREMLERDVWKQPRRLTSLDNVIDVQIMRLRKKVDAEGEPSLIRTERGVGYRIGEPGA
ncbi:MAG: response regulator transcription factor [Opitutaceae bacterium]|jgi:DNA-binding response OmpR family regulator|nr:response regulator transcription factor [Opitutaceae bacterium]